RRRDARPTGSQEATHGATGHGCPVRAPHDTISDPGGGQVNSRKNRKAASVARAALALLGVRAASAAGFEVGGQDVRVGVDTAEQCSSAQAQVEYNVEGDKTMKGYGVRAARLQGTLEI